MAYPADERVRAQVIELLGGVWPRMPEGIERARRWGADWFEISTPFTSEADGRVVGVVGVVDLPLVVGGRDVGVAGVHGVCVAAAHRGRGHLRRPMERALRHVDAAGWDAAVLWADEPEIYRRHGFRPVVEHAFAGAIELAPAGRPSRVRLDPGRPADLERLARALAGRTPVSTASGARDRGSIFLVDLALSPALHDDLVLVPELDAIVVAEPIEGGVRLHDVIAPAIPPLRDLLAHLERPGDRVEVLFTPDRLDAPGLRPIAHPDPGLMVRGSLDLESLGPFALPPLARCLVSAAAAWPAAARRRRRRRPRAAGVRGSRAG